MKLQVCDKCGCAQVMRDAWVPVNDPEEVRTFDDLYCEGCEESCDTVEVEVADDFDVYEDRAPLP